MVTPLVAGGQAPPLIGTSDGSDGVKGSVVAIFSKQAHYIERIRMLETGLLDYELTIEDPLALSVPWTLKRQFRRVPGLSRTVYQECDGNERNPVIDGDFTIVLPEGAAAN